MRERLLYFLFLQSVKISKNRKGTIRSEFQIAKDAKAPNARARTAKKLLNDNPSSMIAIDSLSSSICSVIDLIISFFNSDNNVNSAFSSFVGATTASCSLSTPCPSFSSPLQLTPLHQVLHKKITNEPKTSLFCRCEIPTRQIKILGI
ncbi:hypothetical protein [Lysinibacillus fusiformis]|uniref:hypothetical protein n=1 Tax=Lysinibacillus fusiformis TaxID=28031 RepID=UPI00215B48B0|nr:hypothetical protein [Lysinibacillus fusiformis]MCR8852290.1 hypothetical protein [Lysinibacillus fusiformis]WKT78776.1 hypothetical protein QYY55_08160 [Lysinibacillus fusiformis]